MKTTIELPDPVFRKAKAVAAERGSSLKDFFTEAVEELLRRQGDEQTAMPWERAFGGLRDLHRENQELDRLIDAEFETIDEDEWR